MALIIRSIPINQPLPDKVFSQNKIFSSVDQVIGQPCDVHEKYYYRVS